ncbi:MAG: hypothetical protein R2795_20450 [Saprospiraceae bacterium]
MYVNRNYGFWMTFKWSKRPFIVGLVYASIVFVVSHFLQGGLSLPWQPVSVIGIAVAFYLGFKTTVPMIALGIWIFFLMEKIGDYSENPLRVLTTMCPSPLSLEALKLIYGK